VKQSENYNYIKFTKPI